MNGDGLTLDEVRERGEKLGPGVYSLDGVMHVLAEEVCEYLGLDPMDPVAQELVAEKAREIAAEQGIPAETVDEAGRVWSSLQPYQLSTLNTALSQARETLGGSDA